MKLGVTIRNWGPTATPEFLNDCFAIADRSTLDAIWFNDHLGFPPDIEKNPMPIPPEMGNILDPLGFACYLASATSRISFGTGVLVLPYRPAIVTQKLLTTIQVLSGNRFLLGVGAGYLDEEFKALGVPKSQRGKLTDETINLLRESSANETIEANGQPFILKPKLNCPPIYIGGATEIAIPRAVRCGDGWMPMGTLPEDLAPSIQMLHKLAAEAGRKDLEVVAMKTLPLENPQAGIDMAQAYKDVGVTHLVHVQAYDSPGHFGEVVSQFDGEVRSKL
jgi:probable F420-dependent oxidoreductase